MPIKVAMIGAGSLGFTRRLVQDLLVVPELNDTEFAFMDIHEKNLDMVTQICQRDIEANDWKASITSTMDRIEAIRDADYVVSTIRHGGLEAFKHDIEIPLKYGIDQCVGDTLCAGGITYAQRHIPELLSIAEDIKRYAKPNALFMNYANPMAMNTWALNKYSGVRAVGLCHGVEHGFSQICEVLGIPEESTNFICAGINHQTWYLSVKHQGEEMTPKLLDAYQKHEKFSQTEKVRVDMLKRFGCYSTESNGHLSEYVPWYRKNSCETEKWIDLSNWINGETGGYLRVCEEGRDWFIEEFPKLMSEEPPVFDKENPDRSKEHFSYIIEAEQTGRIYRGHFNVQNEQYITNLPQGCVVELPCFVDAYGIHPQRIGDLPMGCAAVLNNSVSVQQLGMEAAVKGDAELFRQALMMDPLTSAICTPEEIWQMADELLVATSDWLPQYSEEVIEAARQRLLDHPPSYPKAQLGVRHEGESAKGDMNKLLEDSGKGKTA